MFLTLLRIAGAAVFAIVLAAPAFAAEGTVELYPRRVVFGVGQRDAEMLVMNGSSHPVRFEVTLERLRLDEYGDWSTATAAMPGEQFADGIVRLAPRRGEVPPHSTQVIRFQRLTAPAGDEARAHVSLSLISGESTTLVKIPLLVKARPNALARVRAVRWSAPEAVEVLLERQGTTSVYGAVELAWVGPDGHAETVERREVAMYPPFEQRVVLLAVEPRGDEWRLQARFQYADSIAPQ